MFDGVEPGGQRLLIFRRQHKPFCGQAPHRLVDVLLGTKVDQDEQFKIGSSGSAYTSE